MFLSSINKLNKKELYIYNDLKNNCNKNIISADKYLRSNYYGPYKQPIEYLIN